MSHTTKDGKSVNVRKLTVTAMLSAIAFVLMYLEFPVPFVPTFIKMDFSDLPALIGAFAYGPASGVIICFVKNALHLLDSSSGGVGEISNFILSAVFVFTAGMIYKRKKSRTSALIGSLVGAVLMSLFSIISNYFFVYPIYTNFMPMETIIGMYSAIFPSIDNLLEALVKVNVPFTFIKAMFSVVITFLIYKHISPLLKGTNHK
jgi:riboflavin transporter FmnP